MATPDSDVREGIYNACGRKQTLTNVKREIALFLLEHMREQNNQREVSEISDYVRFSKILYYYLIFDYCYFMAIILNKNQPTTRVRIYFNLFCEMKRLNKECEVFESDI